MIVPHGGLKGLLLLGERDFRPVTIFQTLAAPFVENRRLDVGFLQIARGQEAVEQLWNIENEEFYEAIRKHLE